MPLSESQIANIGIRLKEQEVLVGDIIQARNSLRALCLIHGDVPDVNCLAVIQTARENAKAAADALSASMA